MLGWLKRRAELASLRAATQDLDRFLAHLQGATSEELGMVVAIATILRINFRNEGILPDAVVGVGLPATPDEEISTIIQLPRWIQLFQKEGQPSDAAGAMVWLPSVRVIALYPERRNKGREMWRELHRGFGNDPQALDDIQALTGKSVPTEAFDMVEFVPPSLRPLNT
jgi:hypothetical protein